MSTFFGQKYFNLHIIKLLLLFFFFCIFFVQSSVCGFDSKFLLKANSLPHFTFDLSEINQRLLSANVLANQRICVVARSLAPIVNLNLINDTRAPTRFKTQLKRVDAAAIEPQRTEVLKFLVPLGVDVFETGTRTRNWRAEK